MTEIKQNLKWALVFLCIIAVSAAAILIYKGRSAAAKTAQIVQNGKIVRTVELTGVSEPYEFEIVSDCGGSNTVRVENGKIGIVSATCPDKICVKQGFISTGALPIVCLPNKLSVVITEKDDEIDAVSGGV